MSEARPPEGRHRKRTISLYNWQDTARKGSGPVGGGGGPDSENNALYPAPDLYPSTDLYPSGDES